MHYMHQKQGNPGVLPRWEPLDTPSFDRLGELYQVYTHVDPINNTLEANDTVPQPRLSFLRETAR